MKQYETVISDFVSFVSSLVASTASIAESIVYPVAITEYLFHIIPFPYTILNISLKPWFSIGNIYIYIYIGSYWFYLC